MNAPLPDQPPSFEGPPPLRSAAPPPPAGAAAAGPPPPPRSSPPAARGPLAAWRLAWSGRLREGLDAYRWRAWLSSAVVHALALIALSLWILAAPARDTIWITGAFETLPAEDVELDLSAVPLEGETPSLGPTADGNEVSMPGDRSDTIGDPVARSGAGSLAAPVAVANLSPVGAVEAGRIAALSNPLTALGGGLDGRRLENRRSLALSGGGTVASEAAVERALAWFAEHQWPDGGWQFDLEQCPTCHGYCRNSGNHTSSTAATGLALLSFLGAGYTHQDGKYQEVVAKGLYYLNDHMRITSHGGDLRDSRAALETEQPLATLNALQLQGLRRDSMYSHGIATLALTEGYAMTRDRAYREPAEQAIKFIVTAQYDDGGWRYSPALESPGPGDMTVTGWQMAALKSGSLAGIDIPYDVWRRARDFLDSLQDDGGASYSYMKGRPGTGATTASGLLCRMVTGWARDYRPLQRGVGRLGAQQPQRNNMYFNYYASQVLHHVGGPQWEKWNPAMREYLVQSQATDGHELGSWYFAEPHSTPGGRLYTTAMATMTLEVYYRYMPLYQEAFVDRAP